MIYEDSVIQTSYVTFASMPTATNVDLYTYDNQGNISANPSSTSCISILSNNLAGQTSFARFDNKGDLTSFEQSIQIFNGSNINVAFSYVGIVFDYYDTALQDIFSHFLGDPLLDDGLQFACDWSTYL